MARIARWKIVLGVIAVVAILVGVAVLWIRFAADRRWEGMRARALEILREDRQRWSARPVLRGTAVAGNAWDHYEAALKILRIVSPEELSALRAYCTEDSNSSRSDGPPSRSMMEAVLRRAGGALAELRQGAARSDAWYEARDFEGRPVKSLSYLPLYQMAALAAVKSRLLAADGRAREAADLLLDLAQFARDCSIGAPRCGEFGWMDCLNVFIREMTPLIFSNRLSTEDLLDVDRALEILDGSFRQPLVVDPTELQEFGFEFVQAADLHLQIREGWPEADRLKPWASWRFGFSERLMVADAFDEGMALVRLSRSWAGVSWTEVLARIDEVDQRLAASPNPMSRIHLRRAVKTAPMVNLALARPRLLRVAAHYRATGEFLDLDDLLGGKLRREENGCRWKIWSVGPNRRDDRGKIVLEFDR